MFYWFVGNPEVIRGRKKRSFLKYPFSTLTKGNLGYICPANVKRFWQTV